MNEKSKDKLILKYLFTKGPAYTYELEKYFEKKIPRSTFYYNLKLLLENELIKKKIESNGGKSRTKYIITDKGIRVFQSEIENPASMLKINLKDIENNFFPIIEKLDREFPINPEHKTYIFLTWPLVVDIIPNSALNEIPFSKIKLFILVNQLTHNLKQKELIPYSLYSKIFNLKKIDLKFYVKRFIEYSTFPDWHKLKLSSDQDVFYSFSFGFGRILYSLITYFMKKDVTFDSTLNLTPWDYIENINPITQKKIEKFMPTHPPERLIEQYFDYEKEIMKILPTNLRFTLRKFFESDYLNTVINYSNNIPYERLRQIHEWRVTSGKQIISRIFKSLNKSLNEPKTSENFEIALLLSIISDLKFFFEIDKIISKLRNNREKIIKIDSCINFLNEKWNQILGSIQENKKPEEFLHYKNIEKNLKLFQLKFGNSFEDMMNIYKQIIDRYNEELVKPLKTKLITELKEELENRKLLSW